MSRDTIRTRPDGSIDTAFYMQRGRALRSAQAHRLFGFGRRHVRATAPGPRDGRS